MTDRLHFTIPGEPSSKANSRRLVTVGGSPRFIKSKDAIAYTQAVKFFAPVLPSLLTGELAFEARIYYTSQRKDLDPSIILDGLQGRIYENDRQIREMHLYHGIDKDNPRAEISIYPRPVF